MCCRGTSRRSFLITIMKIEHLHSENRVHRTQRELGCDGEGLPSFAFSQRRHTLFFTPYLLPGASTCKVHMHCRSGNIMLSKRNGRRMHTIFVRLCAYKQCDEYTQHSPFRSSPLQSISSSVLGLGCSLSKGRTL